MFIVQFLANILSILRSAATPTQIAFGFCLGMFIGLIPSFAITSVIAITLIVLNVNIGAALFSMALFSILAYVFDPFFHTVGYFLLVDAQELHSMWTALYNLPFIPFSHFNNTVVMGSLFSSLVLTVPVFIGVKHIVFVYRQRYDTVISRWKLVRAIQASTFYQWYKQLKRIGDQL